MNRLPTPASRYATPQAMASALHTVRDRLLERMHADGFWEGRLSSSALSTATAISALALADAAADAPRLCSGSGWLSAHQNADGGWGDTTDSPSNLATTLLAMAALKLAAAGESPGLPVAGALQKAEGYLTRCAAGTAGQLAEAMRREYGEDRTFAVPILMNCGLAGLVAWDDIPHLPFELAVFPHRWYKRLRLQVVSYALPALIAIGLLIDRRKPYPNLLRRLLRRAVTPHVLEKLRQIQPDHGGFLEATPLTSFVAMAMIPLFGRDHCVAARCLEFLRQSQRSDGSWPIDTNLSVWLTTAAVAALATAGQLPRIDRARTAQWIAAQQHQVPHPYTHAAPGGWAWTHLAGGVVDVDDTSGAIIALAELGHRDGIALGVEWLLDLQNRDGGWPTFCRGWGKLPFDKSAPDLSAHALRALCCADLRTNVRRRRRAIRRGIQYLQRAQQPDGSWIPLWFGNQAAPGQTNPVLGTSRVLRALEVLDHPGLPAARGVAYLLQSQSAAGGWGGAKGVACSVEETALAVAALVPWAQTPEIRRAVVQGGEYLVRAVTDLVDRPAPIGLYFAHLWYSEQLYPLIWTLDALGRVMKSGS
jgi:squalene-hopene/tetraprenyl-beta-curcumene cyclase